MSEQLEVLKTVAIEGTSISIVSPEDLLLSKLCWARDGNSEMQLRDGRNIILSRKDLDYGYLEPWADRLGIADLLRRCRAEAA